jgi:hypothetical protein
VTSTDREPYKDRVRALLEDARAEVGV